MPDHHSDGDKNNLSFKLFEVEQIIKEIFISYKLDEIRTPALEDANLFNRSVGNTSDIVNKEIYIFNDRNDKAIALRPEGTASVIRSIIEKKLDQTSHKLWYMGPMWRYERPQKGRYRQFNQDSISIYTTWFRNLICNTSINLRVQLDTGADALDPIPVKN